MASYTPSRREVLVRLWRPVAAQVRSNAVYADLRRGRRVRLTVESLRVLAEFATYSNATGFVYLEPDDSVVDAPAP